MSVPQTDLAGVNDTPGRVLRVVPELPGLRTGYTLLTAVQVEVIAPTPLTYPAHLVFSYPRGACPPPERALPGRRGPVVGGSVPDHWRSGSRAPL